MTMHGAAGAGPRGVRLPKGDIEAQKKLIAQAPRIDNLPARIAALFRPYRAQLLVIVVLVVASAGLGIVPPLITQRIFDNALFPADGSGPHLPILYTLVGAMLGVLIGNQALSLIQTFITSRVGNNVMGDLRVQLYQHLQKMDIGFFTRTKTGVIQSRLFNDVGGVAGVLTNTVQSVIGNTVTVLASFIAMILLSWQLTIVAVIFLPFMVWGQRRVGQIRARIAGKTQESLSEMTAITQETLSVSGVLLSKTYSQQDAETARFRAENDNLISLQIRQTMSGQLFFAVVQIFMSAVPALVYLLAGWFISGGHTTITAGTIVAFTAIQARLLFPLMGLMRVVLDIQTSSALFARIFEYLDFHPAITDAPDAISPPSDKRLAGRVDFDDVHFRFAGTPKHQSDVLAGISFSIAPGEFVAFVGPSGSGKTTIGNLIPRLYDATAGTVSYAGVDVKKLKSAELMANIGVVTQDPYLFHASIADNLRYGKPDATITELHAAARAAHIHDTIMSFNKGYDTIVGERGYRLSGGEKQRIAIARVLLKNPRVLILDEATSALDTVNERAVQGALDAVSAGRTTIAIAHRLSTIEHADRIFVVDSGRIIEQGTHAQLLTLNGSYAALYAQQASPGDS
ncbi:MAG: ABC transporter ATP-binding protein [Corynebacterium sp.]|nr:ABC transporter ATP-binding protein [Corynebacterium sp.]